ncbi:MAG TPA: hypothetical protein GXZ64_02305 [Clostridiaceae bacterium]|nr:hypothetical protein [Clostridiaceae bacterium]
MKSKKPAGYRILILILVLLFGLAMPAYALEAAAAETEEAETEAADAEAPSAGIDQLYSYTFSLEGDTYTLPFPVAYLLDKGWSFVSESQDTMLAPKEMSWDESLSFEDLELRVRLKNFSDSDLSYEQADVVGISVYPSYSSEREVAFELPGEIKAGALVKDIIAIYGQPNYESDYEINYGHDGYAGLSIELDRNEKNEAIARSFSYISVFLPASPEDIDGLDLKDVPDIADYIPPEELGIKLANMVVSLDGKLLRMPAPLSELLTDGWKVAYLYGGSYDDSTVIDPSTSLTVYLTKGNAVLQTTVLNQSRTEKVQLENCRLITIGERLKDGYADQANLVVAQDIGIGSDRRSVVLLYIDLKPDVSVYGTLETYSIDCYDGTTSVSIEDDAVIEIQIRTGW